MCEVNRKVLRTQDGLGEDEGGGVGGGERARRVSGATDDTPLESRLIIIASCDRAINPTCVLQIPCLRIDFGCLI